MQWNAIERMNRKIEIDSNIEVNVNTHKYVPTQFSVDSIGTALNSDPSRTVNSLFHRRDIEGIGIKTHASQQ
jgi:hypothetical protein